MKQIICPLPHVDFLKHLKAIEDLKKEFFEACSIPYPFLKGRPSKVKTASEVEILLRNRLIDNMKLVNQ